MKKILVVIGTRPEAIKMAPVVKALLRVNQFEVRVCGSGQHVEMVEQVLQIFDLEADFMLPRINENSLTTQSGTLMKNLEAVVEGYKPNLVLVHGDTATTLAASLVCYFSKINVCHVEAGLRTNNLYSPWPEEGNRRLTGVIANLHFAPTSSAKRNLVKSGVAQEDIYVTGNTVIDSLNDITKEIESDEKLERSLDAKYENFTKTRFILVTTHRRENYGSGFRNICEAILDISRSQPATNVILPVHPNPAVKDIVIRELGGTDNIILTDPLDYIDFVYLMKRAWLILTDSGGIQEEAPAFGVPVLVMRDTTERPEAITAGTARLVGSSRADIVDAVFELSSCVDSYQEMAKAVNPFGDGTASKRIARILAARFLT